MLSRRSIFSLFAAGAAIAAGAKVSAAPSSRVVTIHGDLVLTGEIHPLTTAELPSHSHSYAVTDPTHSHSGITMTGRQAVGQMFERGMLVTGAGMPDMVADGNGALFMADSPEGRLILQSIAAPSAGKSRW